MNTTPIKILIAAIIVSLLLCGCFGCILIVFMSKQSIFSTPTPTNVDTGSSLFSKEASIRKSIYELCNSQKVKGTDLENCKGVLKSDYPIEKVLESTGPGCPGYDPGIPSTYKYETVFQIVYKDSSIKKIKFQYDNTIKCTGFDGTSTSTDVTILSYSKV
jgi:hypothetical protein